MDRNEIDPKFGKLLQAAYVDFWISAPGELVIEGTIEWQIQCDRSIERR